MLILYNNKILFRPLISTHHSVVVCGGHKQDHRMCGERGGGVLAPMLDTFAGYISGVIHLLIPILCYHKKSNNNTIIIYFIV